MMHIENESRVKRNSGGRNLWKGKTWEVGKAEPMSMSFMEQITEEGNRCQECCAGEYLFNPCKHGETDSEN